MVHWPGSPGVRRRRSGKPRPVPADDPALRSSRATSSTETPSSSTEASGCSSSASAHPKSIMMEVPPNLAETRADRFC